MRSRGSHSEPAEGMSRSLGYAQDDEGTALDDERTVSYYFAGFIDTEAVRFDELSVPTNAGTSATSETSENDVP